MHEGATLLTLFTKLSDPRIDRKKLHPLGDILSIAILAVICGADSWIDIEDFGVARQEWLKQFLQLPNGIPSHDTFRRVFSLIDTEVFEKSFAGWVQTISGKLSGQIAIDGKSINGSGNRRKGKEPLWIVSAWASDLDLVLAETQVNEKSNEITAVPELLDLLYIKGCIVSLDAMGCQKTIAEEINHRGGKYVLAVKGNQGNLHAEIENFFGQAEAIDFDGIMHDQYKSTEENRGRKETRKLYTTGEIDWLPMKKEWAGIRSVVHVVSERESEGKLSIEHRYYISSMEANAEKQLTAVRNHWGIENKQHWMLDVGFSEDQSRVRDRQSGKNLATLRRMALNLLKLDPKKAGIKRKRLQAGWDDNYLAQIIA